MGKTRDLFKKMRDTKGTFHAQMGTIKDNILWPLQEQKILSRGGKNTQNYKLWYIKTIEYSSTQNRLKIAECSSQEETCRKINLFY